MSTEFPIFTRRVDSIEETRINFRLTNEEFPLCPDLNTLAVVGMADTGEWYTNGAPRRWIYPTYAVEFAIKRLQHKGQKFNSVAVAYKYPYQLEMVKKVLNHLRVASDFKVVLVQA